MVKVKGKYITLLGRLMTFYKDAQTKADQGLFERTGKHFEELEPEGWYDGEIIEFFMDAYTEASPTGKNALVTMGRRIFPIIKKTIGLPDFKTPIEALKHDSKTYLMDHKSDSVSIVKPRKILKEEDNHIIIEAPSPGYDPLLFKGVYLGILEMLGIRTGKVELVDEEKCIFDIKW